ncbi:DUF7345 domain-containing protein [Halobacterium yunchengense]|uniref:DUF7345 domain-containing protein n=1 Tax=Halobacterium yunchengense TaxID=3108497 RepID=UPI0030090715
MHRGLACWVAGLLVVASVVAPAAAAGAPDGALGIGQEDFDPDRVTLSAAVAEDGDAEWSFKYRMELTTDNETAAFESLQEDVDENRSEYVDRFRSRIGETVTSAENATGREMSVSNVSVETRLQSGSEFTDSYGFVVYTFQWEGFAAVDGETVTAGDALEGFYLDNETALQFSWPDDYRSVDADPSPDESDETSVRWSGPEDFGTDQPRLVLEPRTGQQTTAGGDGPAETATTTPGGGEAGGGVLGPVLVGALLAVVVLGGAGYVYWRRESDAGGGPAPAADPGSGDGGDGGAAAAAAATGGDDDGDGDAETEPPEELLSNEERVEKFLREQGGRAKQQAVVDAMGWTEAKTSQVVKDMREADDLESFRIGRENVLKLPEADDVDE